MFSTIKAYALASLGLLVTGLLITVKILGGRNTRLKKELEHKEAQIHHAKVVAKGDKKIEEKFRSRRAEIKDEIKNTGGASAFRNPNELRNKDDNSGE